MKRKTIIATLLVLLMSNLLIIRCDLFKDKNTQCFSGEVVDGKGNPIQGAFISIGGQKGRDIETSKSGEFKICAKPNKDQRYVLNVEKLGFGFVSKIYSGPDNAIVITMENATVRENLNPNDNISITDNQPNTATPAQPDYTRISSPLDTIPFVYDSDGRLIAFGAPPEVERTYEAIDQFRPQRRGATVTVEPDALEDPTADRKQQGAFFQASKSSLGAVTGSVSTVDVYSADGMPGDYTTRMQDGGRGFMVTYGAVDVNFYSNGKPLQLKKGKFATISIPVDTLALLYGEKLPPTIPLLVYDKETGLWQRDGNNVGTLNKAGTAYEAKVSHFSVFNMDEEFGSNAACYKLCSGAAPAGAIIQITGVIPGHIKNLPLGSSICGTSGSAVGCNAGESAYAINNMKPNEPIGVRLFDGSNVRASYVLIAGGLATPNETNCSNNYNGCLPSVAYLNWTTACYQNINGTLTAPILAVRRSGSTYDFSWLYIDTASPATSNSTAYYYSIEYKTQPNSDEDFDNSLGWNKVDFDGGSGQTYVFPGAATTNIRNKIMGVSFSGGTTNPVIPATDFLFFRVNYGTDSTNTDGFTKGTIYVINLPASGLFFNDFENDVSCYTK